MTINAKFTGICARCKGKITPGESIDWDKDSKTTTHTTCVPASTTTVQSAPYHLRGGSGYGCYGWKVGETIQSRKFDQKLRDHPEYVTIVTARREYIPEDGMSFGVGNERGYIYYATARAATPEEIQPLIQKKDAQRKKVEATKVLKAAAEHIKNAGERPEGTHSPEGETIPIGKGQDIYGGGEWFVLENDYIWYVMNNGSDGANWAWNNIMTGGAGAIGWRVPTTEALAQEIVTAAAAQ